MSATSKSDTKTAMQPADAVTHFVEDQRRTLDWLLDPSTGLVKEECADRQPCPVCEASDEERLFTRDGFGYVRCRACGLIYVSPRLKDETLEEYYRLDESLHYYYREILEATRVQRQKRIFEPRLRRIRAAAPRGKLLDIGCALGHFLDLARSAGYVVSGIEPNQYAAAHARAQGFMIYESPLADLRLPARSMDVVTMWDSLEPMQRPREVLLEARRILKPRGRLYITCANIEGILYQVAGLEKVDLVGAPKRLNYFTAATLGRLLRGCGFQTLERSTPGVMDIEHLREYYERRPEAREQLGSLFEQILFEKSAAMEALREDAQLLLQRHNLSGRLYVECIPGD